MKRNLSFWTRYTWDIAQLNLIGVGILTVICLLGAESVQWQLAAVTIPYFLFVISLFFNIMVNCTSHILYIPLLISMGETRRNVFLGYQYYRVLIISVTLALIALVWGLIPGEVSAVGLRSLPTIAVILILASAVGSITGTVYIKWKWASVLLMVLFGAVFGGFGGFTFAAGVDFMSTAGILDIVTLLQELPLWLLLASVVALIADVAFQWTLLCRREIK